VFLFVFALVVLYVLFVLSLLSPTLRSPVFTASTMKRERDRQIENSKSATAALREDAETQRRLAGLLEKEKTELKNMLQEKWKEARHLKDRLEESDAKLYEASNTVDNWQETKRDLENTVDKQKRRMHEIKTKASATEDRISAELKDATGYGIVCGGGCSCSCFSFHTDTFCVLLFSFLFSLFSFLFSLFSFLFFCCTPQTSVTNGGGIDDVETFEFVERP
jgi:hypothetical protein